MAMVRCPICYAQTETSVHTCISSFGEDGSIEHTCISCQNIPYFHKNTAYKNKSLRDAVKEYDVLQETTFKRRRTSSTATSSSTSKSSTNKTRKNQNKVVKKDFDDTFLGSLWEMAKYTAAAGVVLTLGLGPFG